MPAQYSTSLSDGILVISALTTAKIIASKSITSAIGFILMAIAASLGVIRFSSANAAEGLIGWHKYMSWMTQSVGLPLIGSSYLRLWHPYLANAILASSIAILVLQNRVLSQKVGSAAGEAIGAVVMVAILVQSVANVNGFGILGVALFGVAALAVKTEGQIYGFRRVDVFHYILAIANIALVKGLQEADFPPIFYTPSKV